MAMALAAPLSSSKLAVTISRSNLTVPALRPFAEAAVNSGLLSLDLGLRLLSLVVIRCKDLNSLLGMVLLRRDLIRCIARFNRPPLVRRSRELRVGLPCSSRVYPTRLPPLPKDHTAPASSSRPNFTNSMAPRSRMPRPCSKLSIRASRPLPALFRHNNPTSRTKRSKLFLLVMAPMLGRHLTCVARLQGRRRNCLSVLMLPRWSHRLPSALLPDRTSTVLRLKLFSTLGVCPSPLLPVTELCALEGISKLPVRRALAVHLR